jgi:hypothetical protein
MVEVKCKRESNPITGLTAPDFKKKSAHQYVKVFSRTYRPPLPIGNIPDTYFCYRLSQPQGHIAAGRAMPIKNSNDTIGNRNRDLPACSAVPQPTALHTQNKNNKISMKCYLNSPIPYTQISKCGVV